MKTNETNRRRRLQNKIRQTRNWIDNIRDEIRFAHVDDLEGFNEQLDDAKRQLKSLLKQQNDYNKIDDTKYKIEFDSIAIESTKRDCKKFNLQIVDIENCNDANHWSTFRVIGLRKDLQKFVDVHSPGDDWNEYKI